MGRSLGLFILQCDDSAVERRCWPLQLHCFNDDAAAAITLTDRVRRSGLTSGGWSLWLVDRWSTLARQNITALSVELVINWFAISPRTSSSSVFPPRLSLSLCLSLPLSLRVSACVVLCIAMTAMDGHCRCQFCRTSFTAL